MFLPHFFLFFCLKFVFFLFFFMFFSSNQIYARQWKRRKGSRWALGRAFYCKVKYFCSSYSSRCILNNWNNSDYFSFHSFFLLATEYSVLVFRIACFFIEAPEHTFNGLLSFGLLLFRSHFSNKRFLFGYGANAVCGNISSKHFFFHILFALRVKLFFLKIRLNATKTYLMLSSSTFLWFLFAFCH